MGAAGNEVWAEPLSINRERGILTVLFSTTPHTARDPITLSRWIHLAQVLATEELTPRNASEQALYHWVGGDIVPGQVVPLIRHTDAGMDLWGADLHVDDRMLGPHFCYEDHNASLLWLGFGAAGPVALGPVGADVVALERLASFYRQGGQPAMAARVQANFTLHRPPEMDEDIGAFGAAALVLVTFDPAFPPQQLVEVADLLYDLKEEEFESVPSLLRTAQDAVLANEAQWHYHRRFRLPLELTNGRLAYLADIWFHRPFLADRYLSLRQPRLMPVLAQPGDTGGIELLPHDRVAHFWPDQSGAMFALQLATG
jgi:hypothetical protein